MYVRMSIQKQTDVVFVYLSITYFSFNFRFLSASIACLTEREQLNSDSFIRNFRQILTFQNTVNANELCTNDSQDRANSGYVSYVG